MHQRQIRRGRRLPSLLLTTLIILSTCILTYILRPGASLGQATFNYTNALQVAIEFFDANRCGTNVATGNVFSWRGPCHTTDGTGGVNLTGGFHDAGDHVKFG